MQACQQPACRYPGPACKSLAYARVCDATKSRVRLVVSAAFTLRDGKGATAAFSKAQVVVGAGASCDVRIQNSAVAEQHATITQKGKQTFLRPMVGESLLDDSRCWKDGTQLRPGVSYVLANGCSVAFGTEALLYTVEFDEGTGSNPLVEMVMKGMVANSSSEVKKALGAK